MLWLASSLILLSPEHFCKARTTHSNESKSRTSIRHRILVSHNTLSLRRLAQTRRTKGLHIPGFRQALNFPKSKFPCLSTGVRGYCWDFYKSLNEHQHQIILSDGHQD